MKHTLSRREMQVVSRLAKGMCLREISIDLNVGYQAIRNYVRRSFKKTNLHSQLELVDRIINKSCYEEEITLP